MNFGDGAVRCNSRANDALEGFRGPAILPNVDVGRIAELPFVDARSVVHPENRARRAERQGHAIDVSSAVFLSECIVDLISGGRAARKSNCYKER